jgi:hypothetical protein
LNSLTISSHPKRIGFARAIRSFDCQQSPPAPALIDFATEN